MKHLLIGIIAVVLFSCNTQNKTSMSEQSKKVGTIELVIFDTYPQYSKAEVIAAEFDCYKQCRRMEKLIDELARGRKMEKILRNEKK